MDERHARAVAQRFSADGRVLQAEYHPRGHIHDTWFVTTADTELVLQRLNDQVFPDCVLMMSNVMRITTHLARRHPERPHPEPQAAEDGSLLVYDSEGRPWRAFNRLAGCDSPDVVTSCETAREVGRAYGAFLTDMQGLRGPELIEPIPGFKDFERRRENFDFIVDLDPYNRAAGCQGEILDVRQHHRLVRQHREALLAGWLPDRIVHNDAKAANVLVDTASGKWLCVVDLDTVAPGTVLFDIGDLLRSATVTWPEDAGDIKAIGVRDNLLAAVLEGYLGEAGELLTGKELELITLAGPLMAYESALRFLTDYLAGDSYFKIDRPRHNLERARAQLRVLAALEHAGDRVASIVKA
ncbi:MAG: phosphotransferase enzyme family protein [Acidimicrobiales bacterium]